MVYILQEISDDGMKYFAQICAAAQLKVPREQFMKATLMTRHYKKEEPMWIFSVTISNHNKMGKKLMTK